jgi:hypothetical protein
MVSPPLHGQQDAVLTFKPAKALNVPELQRAPCSERAKQRVNQVNWMPFLIS